MLSSFWDRKVKGQGHSRQRHNLRQQPVEFHLVDVNPFTADPVKALHFAILV